MKAKPVLAAIVLTGSFWVSCWLPAQATEIYRWVDEKGQTQVSDRVPEQYIKFSTKTDSRKFETTTEQRRETETRVELERRRLAEFEQRRRAAQKVVSTTTNVGQILSQSTPAPDNSCDARMKRFRASERCFSSYKTVWGIKAEAFHNCPQVENPTLECVGGEREESPRWP